MMGRKKIPLTAQQRTHNSRLRNCRRLLRQSQQEMVQRGKELTLLARLLKPSKLLFTDEEMYDKIVGIIENFERRNTQVSDVYVSKANRKEVE